MSITTRTDRWLIGEEIPANNNVLPPTFTQAPPAPLHHLKIPSSPPVTKAPGEPCCGGFGLQDTLHTSPVSWIVDTAVLVPRSHTLIALSAPLDEYALARVLQVIRVISFTYPERSNRPSGDTSVLKTQDECPDRVATAPDPGLPVVALYRTSWIVNRLSSEADTSNYSLKWRMCEERLREVEL